MHNLLEFFTMEELAKAHNLSLFEMRRKLKTPPQTLSTAERQELANWAYEHSTYSTRQIMNAWKTTRCEVYAALNEESARTAPPLDHLHALNDKGYTHEEIASELNCTAYYVRKHLSPKRRSNLTELQKQFIVDSLWFDDSKDNLERLASMFSRHSNSLRQYRPPHYRPRYKQGKITDDLWLIIEKELANGHTITGIARRYGIARSSIYHRKNRT